MPINRQRQFLNRLSHEFAHRARETPGLDFGATAGTDADGDVFHPEDGFTVRLGPPFVPVQCRLRIDNASARFTATAWDHGFSRLEDRFPLTLEEGYLWRGELFDDPGRFADALLDHAVERAEHTRPPRREADEPR
jgi:hypothetical protein